jgi:hypothetical protein
MERERLIGRRSLLSRISTGRAGPLPAQAESVLS